MEEQNGGNQEIKKYWEDHRGIEAQENISMMLFELLGSVVSSTCVDLVLSSEIDHWLNPRLTNGWLTQESNPNNTAKALKVEVTLKQQPRKGQ